MRMLLMEVIEDVPEPLRVVVGIYFYWKFMHLYGELRVFYPRVTTELLLLNTHMDADGTLNVWEEDEVAERLKADNTHHRFFPVDTSSIHIESRKLPTKSLFDVGSIRISIFILVNLNDLHQRLEFEGYKGDLMNHVYIGKIIFERKGDGSHHITRFGAEQVVLVRDESLKEKSVGIIGKNALLFYETNFRMAQMCFLKAGDKYYETLAEAYYLCATSDKAEFSQLERNKLFKDAANLPASDQVVDRPAPKYDSSLKNSSLPL
ncbi:hypothetical protein Tco_0798284 [Tanacetum coccineum]